MLETAGNPEAKKRQERIIQSLEGDTTDFQNNGRTISIIQVFRHALAC